MRMQVTLDSLFSRRGSAPTGGVKKGEFRDWNSPTPNTVWGAEVKKIQVMKECFLFKKKVYSQLELVVN